MRCGRRARGPGLRTLAFVRVGILERLRLGCVAFLYRPLRAFPLFSLTKAASVAPTAPRRAAALGVASVWIVSSRHASKHAAGYSAPSIKDKRFSNPLFYFHFLSLDRGFLFCVDSFFTCHPPVPIALTQCARPPLTQLPSAPRTATLGFKLSLPSSTTYDVYLVHQCRHPVPDVHASLVGGLYRQLSKPFVVTS
jgi:hypothetical protein